MSMFKQTAPFFAMIGTSIFGLNYYQKAKYEIAGTKKQTIADPAVNSALEELGMNSNKPLDKIYEEFSQTDTDNWENVRGPRAEEDNTEWITAMQKRKEEREKEKAYKRANLTHIQKVLNIQSEYWTNRP